MEQSRASWLAAGLALCVAALIVPAHSSCDRGFYQEMIEDFCLTKFRLDMSALDPRLWCSWPQTMDIYEDVTNCTFQIAIRMDCFWPDHVVDRFFTAIHHEYFHDCALTGRLLHDPPPASWPPSSACPSWSRCS
ncbi:hypothetical protein WMY93_022819 [Mugilogobius chulae]|uniref:Receptor activity-modifying protein 1 n=1 Tax=Mugilogobius chulae TaxID=88201 RepID=A0AAW0NI37_9GOBI